MSWVSPTGYNDPDGQWNNEPNAYDEDTGTKADTTKMGAAWSSFIELTHAAITSDKLRYYVSAQNLIDKIDVDVYTDTWVDVYEGSITQNEWVEKTFTQASITKARIRFHVNYSISRTAYVHEFDFWEVAGGPIEKTVEDSLSLSDAVLINKTLVVEDSVGAVDNAFKDWSPQIPDQIAVSDEILINKTLIMQDAINLTDLIDVVTEILKQVSDSIGLSDKVLINKTLIVTDTTSLMDQVLGNKQFEISDSISLADEILRDKEFTISDTVSLADVIERIREALVTDEISSSDQVLVNKTLLLTDQIQLSDNVFIDKILIVSDEIALAEVVEKIVEGIIKTKLFLIIGNMAIQLTGD